MPTDRTTTPRRPAIADRMECSPPAGVPQAAIEAVAALLLAAVEETKDKAT